VGPGLGLGQAATRQRERRVNPFRTVFIIRSPGIEYAIATLGSEQIRTSP
jgi:hypothetical protein